MKNITLLSLFNLAIKHIVLIIVIAVVFAGTTFAYCEYIATPRYSASGSILVTNGGITTGEEGVNISGTDVSASKSLVETVTDTLYTNGIYKELSDSLDNKYSFSSLRSRSSVARRDDGTLFIDVHFTAATPQEAVQLVNAYLELAPGYVKQALPGIASTVFNADSATKTYPRTATLTLSAGLLGALATFAMLIVFSLLDTVIHDEEDFKEKFDLPIIGSVPDFNSAKNGKSYKGSYYNYSYEKRGVKDAK